MAGTITDSQNGHPSPPLGDGGIRAVIFDLDGTIADTLPLCINAFRLAIEPLAGKTLTDEEIIATFGPSEEGTIMALAPAYYEQALADYLQYYQVLHYHCPAPFNGIPPLLAYLHHHGLHIAMVTGKGPQSTTISLNTFGISHYFSIVETGSPLGPVKASSIEKVLAQWPNLQKHEVIYVGDAPGDITASRQAGIPVISAAWAASAEPDKLAALQPDELFYSVDEFAVWIKHEIAHNHS
jgi:phosphoglycolate phosphatase/pyrophosphatase PpaX